MESCVFFTFYSITVAEHSRILLSGHWDHILRLFRPLFWEIGRRNHENSCVSNKDGLFHHQEILSVTQSAHTLLPINTGVLMLPLADWLLAGRQPISNDPFTLLPKLSASECNSHCCTHGCNNHKHHESNNIFCFDEQLSRLRPMWAKSITQRTDDL